MILDSIDAYSHSCKISDAVVSINNKKTYENFQGYESLVFDIQFVGRMLIVV
jgi:hypothetical protein